MNESSAVAKPEVCVVVPIWDGLDQSNDTLFYIEQMLGFVEGNFVVIIVDNASPSPITQEFLTWFKDPRLVVIHNDTNLGYGSAANIGVRKGIELGAEYVIVMNQDVIINDAKWIENAFLQHLRQDKNLIMGARLIDFNGATMYDGKTISPYLEGWMIVCHKDTFVDVGFFDPLIFNWHEDAEFCLRARLKGYELKQSPAFNWTSIHHCDNPPVHHLYGRTGYVNLDRYTSDRITEESRQYVIKKHFPNNN